MGKTQGIRAGNAFVELGMDDKLTAGLKRAQKQLMAFGASVRAAGTAMLGLSAGIVGPLLAASRVFVTAGDKLDKMSKRTGVSVEALSELGFAASQSGSDIDDLEKGLKRMVRTISDAGDGMATAKDALAEIGVSVDALQQMSPEQQFKTLAQAFSQITDASKKAALAQEIFGRAGTQLIPLMDEGAAGIERLQEQARALGLTISTDAARSAAQLGDMLDILATSAKAVAFAVGEALGDTLKDATQFVTRFVTRAIKWVKANRELVTTVFKVGVAIGALGAGLVAIGGTIQLMGFALGGVVAGLAAMKAILAALATPTALVAVGLASIGSAILAFTETGNNALTWLLERFGELRTFVGEVVQGISDALMAGDVAAAAGVMWAALKVAWLTGIQPLRELWATLWADFKVTGIEVWSSITGAFRNFRQFMESAFPGLTAGLTEAWAAMVFAFRRTWLVFRHWVSNEIDELKYLLTGERPDSIAKLLKSRGIDPKGDSDAVFDLFESGEPLTPGPSQFDQEMAQLEADYQAAVSEAFRKRDRTPEERAAEHAIEDAAAQARKEAAIVDVIRQRDAALADSVQALLDARASFDQARRDAKAARDQPGLPGGEPPGGNPPLDDAIGSAARQITVQGIFNPEAIRSLSGGSDKTVERLDDVKDILREIARNQRTYQPRFG